ncbi:hypothetical protein J4218_04480 [Candidatus Pacearchaeota archaeon]|nr:hypothetical protein [Candidatus Pacearchaeota archaeon]
MKATAKCPTCKKTLMNDCRGCIEANIDVHKCKGMKEPGVVENISWKITNNKNQEKLEEYTE